MPRSFSLKSEAVAELLLFINDYLNSELSELDHIELNEITRRILAETNDASLIDLLSTCGYNTTTNSFNDNLDVNDLSNKLNRNLLIREKYPDQHRSSQIDIRNTMKSFIPDLLMSYVIENQFHSSPKIELKPMSTFLEGVILLAG